MNNHEKLEEGYSTQRPPMFNGKFYTYWKNRMEIFIKADNYQVWRVIEVGYFEITKTTGENEVVLKPMSEFDKEDFEKMEINALAVKLLHCGLGPNEHNHVMGCKNAKEIWDLLQVTHEGTNEVKRSKIDLLMSKYERFEMQPKESIQEMLTRFTNITNELVSLGNQIPIDEQVRKVLRSLPQDERWRAKVTALQETKDFTKFNIEQLAGSLITHELHLGTSNSEGNRGKGLAFKDGDQEDSEVDEEEVAMLVRRFKRMFNRNNKSRNFTKKPSTSKTDSGCHKCGSLEHFIRECPLWDTEKDIRKAMIAAWGNSESEDEEKQPEEETTHLCLMAKRDEKAYNDELAKEVLLDPNVLKTYTKDALIDLVFELEDDWTHTSIRLGECQRALKVSKEHSTWIENQRADVQSRFFELFDKNLLLKEMNEKLKFENIMVNVELTQYKLANTEVSPSSSSESLPKLNEDFEKLKYDLDELRIEKAKLEKELEHRKERSISQFGIPKWIENAQTKRTEGLGFIRSKHKGKKKYVDLPSYKVCTFCGKTGHLVATCYKKEQSVSKNVRQVWVLVRGNNTWYLDSGCSKHMTGDKSKFLSLEAYPGGTVTFGDNKKGEVIAKGKVGRSRNSEQDNNDYEIGMIRDREEDEETSKQTKEVREEPEQEHKENAEVPNQENPEEQDHGEPGNKENGEETEEEVPQIGVPAREFQPKPFRYRGSHPTDLIISDIGRGTQTRSQLRNFCAFQAFLSIIEPRNHDEALKDADWIIAMQDELNEFERNKVWHL
ncbi:uncharacterized protein LOC110709902 [Chenopodium quinoa]|uniref:uncharacterized protein LOC110709902 n=1 Tax=Chenopodium quinoa TaxID=63459 RepID=UPI000B778660|nr:uncharacterized protein LOC110709902 [Chenopodium quinoa]